MSSTKSFSIIKNNEKESVREFVPAPLESAPWIKVRGTIETLDAINLLSGISVSLGFPIPSLDPLPTIAATEHSEHTATAIHSHTLLISGETQLERENLD